MKTKLLWLEALLLLAPFVALAILWPSLPARVPVHWNLQNQIDGWESKASGLLFPPFLAVGTIVLLHLLPRIDPKMRKRAGEKSRMPALLATLRVGIAAFFLAVYSLQIYATLGHNFPGRILLGICLLLFAFLGNYLTAAPPNYFIGFRTPWTLENADTWRATHRIGGRLMFFGSILLFALQFFISEMVLLTLFLVAVGGLVIWAFWYSWQHFHALLSATR